MSPTTVRNQAKIDAVLALVADLNDAEAAAVVDTVSEDRRFLTSLLRANHIAESVSYWAEDGCVGHAEGSAAGPRLADHIDQATMRASREVIDEVLNSRVVGGFVDPIYGAAQDELLGFFRYADYTCDCLGV